MMGVLSLEMAKVTSKGQITVPVSIRRRLKISEGDKLLFIDSPDGVLMVNPDLLRGGRGAVDSEPEMQEPELQAGGSPVAPLAVSDAEAPAALEAPTALEAAAAAGGAPLEEPSPAVPPAIAAEVPAASVAPPAARPVAPAAKAVKPPASIRGYDLSSLLDDIRSIGSKI